MKKVLLALGVLAFVAMPSYAFVLGGGEFLAKIKDHSALWQSTGPGAMTPIPLLGPAGIVVGAEQRTIFRVTDIFQNGNVTPVFTLTSADELTGVLYDLKVAPNLTINNNLVTIDFVAAGRNPLLADLVSNVGTGPGYATGGVLEVYDDFTKDYNDNPGGVTDYKNKITPVTGTTPPIPFDAGAAVNYWQENNGGHSVGLAIGSPDEMQDGAHTNNNITDGAYWMAASFVDLNYLVAQGIVNDPTLTPGGIAFAPGAVMRETFDLSAGTGHGFAYANVFDGVAGAGFEKNYAGGGADLAILFDLNTPIYDPIHNKEKRTLVYQGPGQWTVDSEDPVVFAGVPEPATLTLLGLGLAGLMGYRRRQK
jgi:hypothetical protein